MRVKICGITSPADARLAADAGADAIGLNFVSGPRRIDAKRAGQILAALGEEICPVGLVKVQAGRLDPAIRELLQANHVRWLQLYGQVDASAVGQLSLEGFACIWPFAVRDSTFATQVNGQLAAADPPPAMILLDAHDPSRPGGTGQRWHWQSLADARKKQQLDNWPPIILAGGLTPDNVARAIRTAAPDAVDVASGVESAPGHKDPAMLQAFVRKARSAWRKRP